MFVKSVLTQNIRIGTFNFFWVLIAEQNVDANVLEVNLQHRMTVQIGMLFPPAVTQGALRKRLYSDRNDQRINNKNQLGPTRREQPPDELHMAI